MGYARRKKVTPSAAGSFQLLGLCVHLKPQFRWPGVCVLVTWGGTVGDHRIKKDTWGPESDAQRFCAYFRIPFDIFVGDRRLIIHILSGSFQVTFFIDL